MYSLPKIKILVDAMFGKLGKFLRIMGFDAEVADNSLADPKVMEQAISQNRMLITRDELFYQEACKHYEENNIDTNLLLYIPFQDLTHQLAVFIKFIHIDKMKLKWEGPDKEYFKSHCAKCNGKTQIVEKKYILDLIPAGTAEKYKLFWKCTNPDCKHVYWVGVAHWKDIFNKINAAKDLIPSI